MTRHEGLVAWARTVRVAATLSLMAALVGCNAGRRISGMVTAGPASIPTVVAADDERLLQPGLGGVDVAILAKGTVVHRATSEADGSFTFNADGPVRTQAVDVQATGEGIMPVRGSVHLPRDGQRLLIIARPRTASPGSGSGG